MNVLADNLKLSPMIPEETFLKIIRSATKAPSGHNAQPWLFTIDDNIISVMPDFNRALPIADPHNRELFISLGCAVQNLVIAAQFYGFRPALQINPLSDPGMIKIVLHEDSAGGQSELFPYISIRQTTRNNYSSQSIPTLDLDELKNTEPKSGVNIRIFIGQIEIKRFSPFITEANSIQLNNPDFKKELIKWMRFSEKEAMQHGDGLYCAAIGMPCVGRWMGSFLLKHMVTARSEEKRLIRLMDNTAALALVTSDKDDVEHWIRAGMAFQDFALLATKLNVNHSFINQPCQVEQVRKKVEEDLKLPKEFPQLLVRLGYSDKKPRSFRRRIGEVMVR